ncbi:MAG: VOC family protein [Acidimicrobiia bacterium]|nr:VOC family protein [Acidimicrobiia bacterium]MDH3463573.1 VOC family protein [Acidimicrobiia bacterium]
MDLGAFSVSLSVKDMAKSRDFYEKLGFSTVGGDEETWLILRSGTTTIGLFHGMFEGNILTFNPGWSAEAEQLDRFDDVRAIRAETVAAGLEPFDDTTSSGESGPASFSLVDPDGNAILIDQHV